MQTIEKIPLPLFETFTLELPFNTQILTCKSDYSSFTNSWYSPHFYAIMNKEADKEERSFEMYQTSVELPELFLSTRNYINTVQIGSLVFHLFEVVN